MSNRAVARRYAQALFELGREQEILAALAEELRVVQRTLEDNPTLRARLEHPRVPAREKIALLEDVFADRVSAHIMNLLRLLVEKHREGYFDAINEAFNQLYDEARGVAVARVRVADELDDAALAAVRDQLGRTLGREVRLQVEVDPSLIGGLVIQIGDRRIDASLRRKLRSLRDHIVQEGANVGVSQA